MQAPEDNSVEPDFITKTWSTSNVKITPVMPIWQEQWETEEKQKRMDAVDASMKLNFELLAGQEYDYDLPALPTGPSSVTWEYQITSISGKVYPTWVSLKKTTGKLEMEPTESDSGKDFYFKLILAEKGTGGVSKEWEIKVHVEAPTPLSYEVTMSDVTAGIGQIRFNLPVNL